MSSGFANPPIDVTGLPDLDDGRFRPLDSNYLLVSFVAMGLFAIAVVVIGTVVVAAVDPAWIPIVVMAGLLTLTSIAAVVRTIEVRHIAYQVREHDISYRHGAISRSVETVPFVRVQHARVTRGPVDRAFGLAKLHVSTAGPDLLIPGLPVADADRIKALIVARAGDLLEEP